MTRYVEGGLALGAALLPALLPGLVAAAIGYLIFVGFGDWGGLDAPGLTLPGLPAYDGTHVLDLAVGVAVGVSAALLIAAVNRFARGIEGLGGRRLGTAGLLLGGGLAVGLLAQFADLLGADAVPAIVLAGAAAWLTMAALDRRAAAAAEGQPPRARAG